MHRGDRKISRWGRRKAVLLACLALLLQIIAPLSPMPTARIGDSASPVTLEGLSWALAVNLCSTAVPADDSRKAPTVPGHGCQICISVDLAGHYVAPTIVALTSPVTFGRADWHRQPLAPPRLAHAVGSQPRGPPLSV